MAKRKRKSNKKQNTLALVSLVIIVLSVVTFILFTLDKGIILEGKSGILNITQTKYYSAWDVIFGVKNGDTVLIKHNVLGIVGLGLLALGAVATLLSPLKNFRFLLSFVSFVTSGILTYLVPQQADLAKLDWGTIATIDAKLGMPLIIALVLQALMAVMSLYLYNESSR